MVKCLGHCVKLEMIVWSEAAQTQKDQHSVLCGFYTLHVSISFRTAQRLSSW